MGELCLAEAKAGRLATRGNTNPSGKGKGCVPQVDTGPATTADLGITRKERAAAQTRRRPRAALGPFRARAAAAASDPPAARRQAAAVPLPA